VIVDADFVPSVRAWWPVREVEKGSSRVDLGSKEGRWI